MRTLTKTICQERYDHGESVAVAAALSHLPSNLQSWWYSNFQLHYLLQLGGFPNIPQKLVEQSLKSARSLGASRNLWKRTTYYLFGEAVKERDSPMKQEAFLRAHARHLPVISCDHFLRHHEEFEKAYKTLEKYAASASKKRADGHSRRVSCSRSPMGECSLTREATAVAEQTNEENAPNAIPGAFGDTQQHAGFIIEDVQL